MDTKKDKKTKKLNTIVLGIVRNVAGKVLIVCRQKIEKGTDGATLRWAFPGGKIEAGETKEKAVVREVKEETGCEVRADFEISSRRHPQFPVQIFYWACALKNVLPRSVTDKEITEVRWVAPAELKNHFTSDLEPKVAECLGIISMTEEKKI